MTLVGVDEAGRGSLAGPVVAASVWLAPDIDPSIFCDSKAISSGRREQLFIQLQASGSRIGVGVLSHRYIDRVNILNATMEAMKRSLRPSINRTSGAFCNTPFGENDGAVRVLVDGNRVPDLGGLSCEAIVKGDATVPCISAASIVAKVVRDRIMVALDRKFPEYGFLIHKGYGTRRHVEAIFKYGPSDVHRLTFNPVRTLLQLREEAWVCHG